MNNLTKLIGLSLILSFICILTFPNKTLALDPLTQSYYIDTSFPTKTVNGQRWNSSCGCNQQGLGAIAIQNSFKISITKVEDLNYGWKITYTSSGYLSTSGYLGESISYGASISLNRHELYQSSSYNTDTFKTYSYNNTNYTQIINKDTNSPKKLFLRVYAIGNTYSPNSAYGSANLTEDKTYVINLNTIPSMIQNSVGITEDALYLNGSSGNRSITLSGKVWDAEGDAVVVTAIVANKQKTLTINNPPKEAPITNNYSLTWDTETDALVDGVYWIQTYVTDVWGDSNANIYNKKNLTVDRIRPSITTTTSYLKSFGQISYTSNELGTVYVVPRGTYTSKSQLDALANGITGNKAFVVSTSTSTLKAPLQDGYYRIYVVDLSGNVSSSSIAQDIVIDGVMPTLDRSMLINNQLILQFSEPLSNTIPSKDDLFITRGGGTRNEHYILVSEGIVTYDTGYRDYESDPKRTEEWIYVHDKSYYENPPTQTASYSNQALTSPVTTFSLPGKYAVTFKAKDNPPPNEAAFDTYDKWSSTDNMMIYVHRKPIASFILGAAISGPNYNLTIIDNSYDLDHESLLNKGIVQKQWWWKTTDTSVWTDGNIPSTVPNNKDYIVKLRVKDMEGVWSDEVSRFINGAVEALDFEATLNPSYPNTVLAGTNIDVHVDVATTATISSVVAQLEGETNKTMTYSGLGANAAQKLYDTSYNVRNTKVAKDYYNMYITVTLVSGRTLTKSYPVHVITNRPPLASFDWSPKPVWEGDTITLANQSTDPDGDALTYSWNIIGPGNYAYSATTTHVSQKFIQSGDYSVRLNVSDGKAQSNITRMIRVEALTIEADVNHTALWLEHHLSMGHETVINPKSFYTGEIFVVSASGSLAATRQVTASLDAIGRDGQPIAISTNLIMTNRANHFLGNLYDPILSSLTGSLPEGPYLIKFKIEYMNGIVKDISIPIQIIGHVQGATNVHRVQ
jgi:hypothetical protein